MQPFVHSTPNDHAGFTRDLAQRQALIEADREFFARRGIDLEPYMADDSEDLTKTPYEKSTGTPPEKDPNFTDSALDQYTKLD